MNRPLTDAPSLRALLDETLDLEPPEREAFLARLQVTYPERAAELERLLTAEADLDASRFLLNPSWSDEGTAVPGLAGLRLGAYTLERLLGKGGMGTVWLGRRSDGRYEATAAVKLFNLALRGALRRDDLVDRAPAIKLLLR